MEVGREPTAARLAFADRLCLARRDRGFATGGELARAAAIEPARYQSLEAAGDEPTVEELVALSGALDVSLDFLVLGVLPRPGEAERPPAKLAATIH